MLERTEFVTTGTKPRIAMTKNIARFLPHSADARRAENTDSLSLRDIDIQISGLTSHLSESRYNKAFEKYSESLASSGRSASAAITNRTCVPWLSQIVR